MTATTKQATILVVDDEPGICDALSRYLDGEGYRTVTASNAEDAFVLFEAEDPDMALVDYRLPGADGLSLLKKMRERRPRLEVVLFTAYGGTDTAIQATLDGACAYLPKPVDLDEVGRLVRRTLDTGPVAVAPRELAGEAWALVLHGSSPATETLRERVRQVASASAPVLLVGEIGSGRELVARAIHAAGAADRRFEVLHCSAEGDDPLAAVRSRGTCSCLVNEVGELELDRALELIQRGAEAGSGCRLIASVRCSPGATGSRGENALSQLGRQHGWSVVEVPSLEERRADLPDLVAALLDRINRERERKLRGIDHGALQAIENRRYRGNLRELENSLRTAALSTPEEIIREGALPTGGTAPKSLEGD